jgi:transposase-like protein
MEEYCRRREISATSLQRWTRHLLSAEELHKRKKRPQNLRIEKLDRQGKKPPSKPSRKAYTYRYNMRTDGEPIAVRAFWGMHVEAMNWSGMGNAEYAAALGLSPYALRIWRNRFADSGEEMGWRSLLHPSARAQSSSAASRVRNKYRLTPQEADGRSNRRRFSEEQKRAIVQDTEKPGVSVSQICRRHGVATSMVFRWRVQFGLLAKKAPQLATVTLTRGATSEVPALAALRNLVQPPNGMVAVELDDGRRVFAPAGSSPAAVKRRLVRKEKVS